MPKTHLFEASAVSQGVEATVKAFLNCVSAVPRAFQRAGRFSAAPEFHFPKSTRSNRRVSPWHGSWSEFEIKESSSFPASRSASNKSATSDFRLEFLDNIESSNPRPRKNKKQTSFCRYSFNACTGSTRYKCRNNFNSETAKREHLSFHQLESIENLRRIDGKDTISRIFYFSYLTKLSSKMFLFAFEAKYVFPAIFVIFQISRNFLNVCNPVGEGT